MQASEHARQAQDRGAANVDPEELHKFSKLADRWWDPQGDFRPLHDINPARLAWIAARASLDGAAVLDVGCGGGLLTEGMAGLGARVTGIDMGEAPLEVARLHLLESGLDIDYRRVSAESLAEESPGAYDFVTCLEVLEHVPSPSSTVAACARLVCPGGKVFFSTINRNLKAWLLAIVGAEYVLRILPRGTHAYPKLIRPAELAAHARNAGLEVRAIAGMHYNPLSHSCRIGRNPDVNYLMYCSRPA